MNYRKVCKRALIRHQANAGEPLFLSYFQGWITQLKWFETEFQIFFVELLKVIAFIFFYLADDTFAPVSFSDFDNLFINCKLIFMRSWLYDYIASWNKLFLNSKKKKDELNWLTSEVMSNDVYILFSGSTHRPFFRQDKNSSG